ncbi:putative apoptosis-inducing taf9-like domain 1 family [Erysiphe necator]|uniref:Putative apoptosis-inducing taf9-like domain 1 family n=1 Tax=Uncinula necator TaxID=52586 RepID=A0A0B1P4D2_UNCNE|nr:putative apoptosis-inducing taf9-like domain 1 family [Erysiphe necator]
MTKINSELEEQLKASLWHKIGTLVTSETKNLSIQYDMPIKATPQFIGSLTEMVWAQIENVAMDLEAFANHAGRTTVGTDDEAQGKNRTVKEKIKKPSESNPNPVSNKRTYTTRMSLFKVKDRFALSSCEG